MICFLANVPIIPLLQVRAATKFLTKKNIFSVLINMDGIMWKLTVSHWLYSLIITSILPALATPMKQNSALKTIPTGLVAIVLLPNENVKVETYYWNWNKKHKSVNRFRFTGSNSTSWCPHRRKRISHIWILNKMSKVKSFFTPLHYFNSQKSSSESHLLGIQFIV